MTEPTPSSAELEALRFPIGRLELPERPLTPEERRARIERIADAPALLREAVARLGAAGLDTPYRPGGWTARQVVHHVADSHINSWVRFRLALTEDHPRIKTYDEAAWGELPDARTADVEISLALLEALHARWTALLASLAPEAWERTLDHPEMGDMTLDQLLAMYAWHGEHHAAHIRSLRVRQGG